MEIIMWKIKIFQKVLNHSMLNGFLLLKIIIYIKQDRSSEVFTKLKELITPTPNLLQ